MLWEHNGGLHVLATVGVTADEMKPITRKELLPSLNRAHFGLYGAPVGHLGFSLGLPLS